MNVITISEKDHCCPTRVRESVGAAKKGGSELLREKKTITRARGCEQGREVNYPRPFSGRKKTAYVIASLGKKRTDSKNGAKPPPENP